MGEFWPVPDVLAYLAGSWRVRRSVRDLASGDEGHFTGTTTFGPLEDDGSPRHESHSDPSEDGGSPHHESHSDPSEDGGSPRRASGVGPPADGGLRHHEARFDPLEDGGSPRRASGVGPPADGGLRHREAGTFVWQGVPRPAERTLLFLRGDRPSRTDVRFADGRPFHGLDLAGGHHVADHPCSADLYRGEFTVHDRDHWRTVWRVRGPAKDLVLTTDYVREP
jgi:hypothetical protein